MNPTVFTHLSVCLATALLALPIFGAWKAAAPVVIKSALESTRGNLQVVCRQITGCQRVTAAVFWNSGRQRYEVLTTVFVTRKTSMEARKLISDKIRHQLAEVATPLNLYRANLRSVVVMFDYA